MKLFQTSALLSLAATAAGYASFSTTNGPRSAAAVRPQAQWVSQQLQAELPQQQQRSAVIRTPEPAMVATGPGLFTSSKPEDRRVVPDEPGDRSVFKVVYVVLESQYQSSLTAACKRINAGQPDVAVECSGYILEELRDPENFAQFKKDVEGANIFIGSLIFVQELADKVVEVVEPNRERMDAVCVFPSMPAVMKLNKIGSFTMASMGQSKSVMSDFMKKNKPKGTSFQDSMLKLVRTLPKVLKYLPGDKAADARSFMMSLQYWLGGSPENIEALLLNLANNYVEEIREAGSLKEIEIKEPEVIPDKGIWHPMAPRVFETYSEYRNWLINEHAPTVGIDPATAPTVGVVLQKSHINTKDDAHYVSLIMELEAKGALVLPTYTGSLDFSQCLDDYFYQNGAAVVDCTINLTGFALVGGPASQDHPKAIAALKKLNRPYLCAVPATFQTFEEWKDSELGLHPVQVALQVALPEHRPGRIDQKLLLSWMAPKNVVDMINHYFQLTQDGGEGLSEALVARVRGAILGDDAKGVPGLDLTPAQVEAMAAEHESVEDMIAALEAMAPSVTNEINGISETTSSSSSTGSDPETVWVGDVPPSPVLPTRQSSKQKIVFE